MSRATFEYLGDDENKKPIYGKRNGFQPAQPRGEKIIEFKNGIKMKVRAAPGQVLNLRKEFERQAKAGTLIFPPQAKA